MIKRWFILMVFPFIFSCNNEHQAPGSGEANPEMDKLNVENQRLQQEIDQRDSAMNTFIESFNEIQGNLDVIKEKEQIISMSTKGAELQKSKGEQIVADIQLIYDLMNENKQKINSLSKKLKNANLKIDEFEKMMTRLTAQLEQKEGEITELKGQLDKLNLELGDLTLNYQEEQQESALKTEKLNTAYYAFGTSKELIKQGVLTKEGGFIGIGKAEKLKEDFNKSYFTRVDITQAASIPLYSKKAKLVTIHPAGSYKLEGTEGNVEKLLITDPDEFWSASKYLVIIVEPK